MGAAVGVIVIVGAVDGLGEVVEVGLVVEEPPQAATASAAAAAATLVIRRSIGSPPRRIPGPTHQGLPATRPSPSYCRGDAPRFPKKQGANRTVRAECPCSNGAGSTRTTSRIAPYRTPPPGTGRPRDPTPCL